MTHQLSSLGASRDSAVDGGSPCPLPACTIDFEPDCPDVEEICGAEFVGGITCIFEDLPFCYGTGLFSYAVDPGLPLTITLSGDLVDVEVFFANVTGSSGEMRFFNAGGVEVGAPIQTNGDCLLLMVRTQVQVFKEPVRSIEVVATGGRVYIDTFMVNPQSGPCCGDGACDGGEDCANCKSDCAACPCGSPGCPTDLSDDGITNAADLAILLGAWGPNPGHCADLNGDDVINAADLALLLGALRIQDYLFLLELM